MVRLGPLTYGETTIRQPLWEQLARIIDQYGERAVIEAVQIMTGEQIMYDEDVQVEARGKGPILAASSDINEALGELNELIVVLERKLDPIMHEPEIVRGVNSIDGHQEKAHIPGSPHLSDLRRHEQMIRDLSSRIRFVIERLEV